MRVKCLLVGQRSVSFPHSDTSGSILMTKEKRRDMFRFSRGLVLTQEETDTELSLHLAAHCSHMQASGAQRAGPG